MQEGDLFCPFCGAAAQPQGQEAAEQKTVKTCRNCGRILAEEDAFCPRCGTAVQPQGQEAAEQKTANVCKNCGKALERGDLFCSYCGAGAAESASPPAGAGQPAGQPYAAAQPAQGNCPPPKADAPSGGFFALCFFFPIGGLILFLVWKDQFPLRSKSCGMGALVGVIVEFVIGFILGFVIGFTGVLLNMSAGAALFL